MVVVFIVVPKNSGLGEYREKALSLLSDTSCIMEARGEDIPFWVEQFCNKGKRAIGLTGEDLYKEYGKSKLVIIKKVEWDDKNAMFAKPALCLIGPEGKNIEQIPKSLTVAISSKYKNISERYLKKLERQGFEIEMIFMTGSIEPTCSEGIADMVIDIVYSGSTMKKYGLEVYDIITKSDFLIIGGTND